MTISLVEHMRDRFRLFEKSGLGLFVTILVMFVILLLHVVPVFLC